MKMKKIVATGSALALTAAVAVGGTLAWLQNSTGPVTNTFTYSKGQDILLDLYEYNGGETPLYNASYTIVPGAEVDKDPTLKLTTTTDSYIYVEILDEMNATVPNSASFTVKSEWVKLQDGDGTDVKGTHGGQIYVYETTESSATGEEYNVFDGLTFSNTLTAEQADSLNGKNIQLYGYAVQSTAGSDAYGAWTAAGFGA